MKIIRDLKDQALQAKKESKRIEFKSEFDVKSTGNWCEIVKDMVAISNSGGGIILFGVKDDGSCSRFDCAPILALDPATITTKIAAYTHRQFSDFRITELKKARHVIAALEIGLSKVPMVFTKEGAYSVGDRQKIAFYKGTLYFRHGAKSEPADSHDLEEAVEKERRSVRNSLLRRIRTIANVPLDRDITIQSQSEGDGPAISLTLSEDSRSTKTPLLHLNKTHPYRQKEIVKLVNERLDGRAVINSHDIQCIRWVYDIDNDLKYYYKPLHTSPHYSLLLVDFIMRKYSRDPSFFEKTREKCRPTVAPDEI